MAGVRQNHAQSGPGVDQGAETRPPPDASGCAPPAGTHRHNTARLACRVRRHNEHVATPHPGLVQPPKGGGQLHGTARRQPRRGGGQHWNHIGWSCRMHPSTPPDRPSQRQRAGLAVASITIARSTAPVTDCAPVCNDSVTTGGGASPRSAGYGAGGSQGGRVRGRSGRRGRAAGSGIPQATSSGRRSAATRGPARSSTCTTRSVP